MKKIITCIISAALLLSLAACDSKSTASPQTPIASSAPTDGQSMDNTPEPTAPAKTGDKISYELLAADYVPGQDRRFTVIFTNNTDAPITGFAELYVSGEGENIAEAAFPSGFSSLQAMIPAGGSRMFSSAIYDRESDNPNFAAHRCEFVEKKSDDNRAPVTDSAKFTYTIEDGKIVGTIENTTDYRWLVPYLQVAYFKDGVYVAGSEYKREDLNLIESVDLLAHTSTTFEIDPAAEFAVSIPDFSFDSIRYTLAGEGHTAA